MERKFPFIVGNYYHLYNRGTDKRTIFLDKNDYNRFIMLLYLCNSTRPVDISQHFDEGGSFAELLEIGRGDQLVDIGVYCLMPNHFHLFVHERIDEGISTFMKKLATGYSMYFNGKYERTGALFEGRFKAQLVKNDAYFYYLFAYIHLNPIKLLESNWKKGGIHDLEKAREYLSKYRYSSYLDYIGRKRPEKIILNRGAFPDGFEDQKEFSDFINYWLTYNDATAEAESGADVV